MMISVFEEIENIVGKRAFSGSLEVTNYAFDSRKSTVSCVVKS